MKDVFENYLLSLRQDRGDKTEHSDRPALLTLLNAAAQAADPGIRIIHEAKKVPGSGAPDFKVMKAAMILGYVENKTVGENLDQILKSDQIARYKALSNNILLTDYLQFIWIKDGKVIGRELIAFPDDLEGRPKKPREDRVKAVSDLLRGFFSIAPEGIGRAQQLALALATRSQFLRDFLDRELRRQEKEHTEARLYGLYQIFRDQVFHELTLSEFADAFAQMLAYGLFLAKLNSNGEVITLANARQFVPGSFRLIRELVQFLDDLTALEYVEIRWVVEELLSIVNGLKLREIHEDLSFKHRKAISRKVRAQDEEEHRLFERDPFIYFYEDFLAKYDAKMKKARGVYYTPPPIVNFIVRAVDDILKENFGIPDGLADHKRVTVLDFACGTGTFLLEVFQRIFDNIGGPDAGRAEPIVREHLLKNVFGFEYLIAPYTIAHLKLSQYLKDQGHPLKRNERLQVFLTNTLEPIKPQANFLLPAISAEVEAAQTVKDREILVIVGNPPYSGESKNKGPWIRAAIDGYKFTLETNEAGREVRKPLGEKNSKWLNDDYVKFIRFAQMKMDAVDEGVVGIITNHSWLDNPTFRGMRQSLMRSFEQIYVLDLHGNAKKKENAPDGFENENVFDIKQGVAISFFVKRHGLERGVWRGDVWGKRLDKYRTTAEGHLKSSATGPLRPNTPYYLFTYEDADKRGQYNEFPSVRDIFVLKGTGIITKRDNLTIHFTPSEVWRVVEEFIRIPDQDLRRTFELPEDVRDWKAIRAKNDLLESGPIRSLIQKIIYRPFDERFTYNTGNSRGFLGWPVARLMQHMSKANIGLLTCRQISSGGWEHVFSAKGAVEDSVISNRTKERGYLFPLYLYPPPDGTRHSKSNLSNNTDSFTGNSRVENIAPAFRNWLDERYEQHFSPEEILGYIYAVLHAPTYRSKYAEFLRIDFPRVPFPDSADEFESLSILGYALVQAHLLRDLPRQKLAAYHGTGGHIVEAVRYSPEEQAVAINKTQVFKPVPLAVWDFHIGGYQVLDKYLKSRKGRVLSLDEMNHVSAIADSLAFTIEQMARIDEAYRAAFSGRG
ncbi:MAG TPA: type ISP restriction/modification enzyme [Methylocella sp.]